MDEGDEAQVFNTNVDDKEERKRIRKARMQAREASNDPEAQAKREKEAQEEAAKLKGQQQIANSLAHLDKKKATGIDEVTMIRVEADWRESQRRIAEEEKRQERLQSLQEEAVRSGKQNAEVELQWGKLLEQNMPQELFAAIQEQKHACSGIIASKDDLIRDFNLQLKSKDEEYVRALKQQSEDIEELLTRMRREFRELQDEYEIELESIEDAFLSERAELMQKNKAEIDSLFDKRKRAELDYMSEKQQREEGYQTEIEELIVHDSEEYNKLKIKLETDIQTLEQQLEEMQATYQLNTEKLEYNFRVLSERDDENSNTLRQLKSKQTKLKDTLSVLVQKYHETDVRDRKRNDELTEEYRRITKQYKDLQAKFRHFELSDNKKFDELWNMHEEEVTELVDQVLKADEIIETQQLGWEWRAPDLGALRRGIGASSGGGSQHTGLLADTASRSGETTAASPSGKANSDADDPAARMVSGAKVKAMMKLMVAEAQFLVDTKVKDAIESLPPEESELAQAESMLRALGVENEDDVQALLEYFFPVDEDADAQSQDYDAAGAAGAGLDDNDAPQAFQELKRLISPDDVILAVSSFVSERKHRGGAGPGAATAPMASTALQATTPVKGRTPGETGSAESTTHLIAGRGGNEEVDYWRRAASVVSDETVQVWRQLEKGLQEYNKILVQRAECIDDVQRLRQENDALRGLLTQYLNSGVNDDLIVPPSQTLNLPR